jgi:hypothetical protein
MIIISDRPGQLGNLLFLYAQFISFGKEFKIKIVNPAFHPYKNYFVGTVGVSFSGNRFFYGFCFLLTKTLHRLKIKNRFVSTVVLSNNEQLVLTESPAFNSIICFVQGWLFRSNDLFKKYKKEIKSFFEPTEFYKNQIEGFFIRNFGNPQSIVIGIHVRLGDYKTFENGIYYYPIDKYMALVEELSVLFAEQNPSFLVCSNEKLKIDKTVIKDLKITFAPGHELLDLYCLAKCNFIAGPPSTYSMWASFYGDVPLLTVRPNQTNIAKNDFVSFFG